MSEYFQWLSLFVFLPTAVLWLAFPRVLIEYRTTYAVAILGSLLVSIPWDLVAVRTGIWQFPDGCCAGPEIAGLPIEEYIFISSVAVYVSTLALVARYYFSRYIERKE